MDTLDPVPSNEPGLEALDRPHCYHLPPLTAPGTFSSVHHSSSPWSWPRVTDLSNWGPGAWHQPLLQGAGQSRGAAVPSGPLGFGDCSPHCSCLGCHSAGTPRSSLASVSTAAQLCFLSDPAEGRRLGAGPGVRTRWEALTPRKGTRGEGAQSSPPGGRASWVTATTAPAPEVTPEEGQRIPIQPRREVTKPGSRDTGPGRARTGVQASCLRSHRRERRLHRCWARPGSSPPRRLGPQSPRSRSPGGNAGSSGSRGGAPGRGVCTRARSAKRSGWRPWWWPTPRWWSTTGSHTSRATC